MFLTHMIDSAKHNNDKVRDVKERSLECVICGLNLLTISKMKSNSIHKEKSIIKHFESHKNMFDEYLLLGADPIVAESMIVESER